jgi:hypothetical protein
MKNVTSYYTFIADVMVRKLFKLSDIMIRMTSPYLWEVKEPAVPLINGFNSFVPVGRDQKCQTGHTWRCSNNSPTSSGVSHSAVLTEWLLNIQTYLHDGCS